ncbi:hypothetical protein BT69DRAFT_1288546 [Atractiella rhizophila]|nr:hypothetical protein BT69DRAFT_1288546 [Atractiella rhizophila]
MSRGPDGIDFEGWLLEKSDKQDNFLRSLQVCGNAWNEVIRLAIYRTFIRPISDYGGGLFHYWILADERRRSSFTCNAGGVPSLQIGCFLDCRGFTGPMETGLVHDRLTPASKSYCPPPLPFSLQSCLPFPLVISPWTAPPSTFCIVPHIQSCELYARFLTVQADEEASNATFSPFKPSFAANGSASSAQGRRPWLTGYSSSPTSIYDVWPSTEPAPVVSQGGHVQCLIASLGFFSSFSSVPLLSFPNSSILDSLIAHRDNSFSSIAYQTLLVWSNQFSS